MQSLPLHMGQSLPWLFGFPMQPLPGSESSGPSGYSTHQGSSLLRAYSIPSALECSSPAPHVANTSLCSDATKRDLP